MHWRPFVVVSDMAKLTLPAIHLPAAVSETSLGNISTAAVAVPEKVIEVDEAQVAELMKAARTAAEQAYAPFSNFSVGAALVMADDSSSEVISGCNIENSSYGGTVCAERTAIFTAAARGFRRIGLLAVTTVATRDAELRDRSPCGFCRQVIREFADEQTLIFCDNGDDAILGEVFDIERLLPFGFQFGGPNKSA